MASLCSTRTVLVSATATGRLYCGLSHKGQLSVVTAARQASRTLSTDLVSVESDPENKDVAILTMNRKPVNSLNLQLLTDLSETLEKLEKTFRGVIFTSSVKNIFSAGLDINELYQKKSEELDRLWSTSQTMWLRLYGSPLVTIAAINGHSPAGGCMLAQSCDYRIMAKGDFTIGLNETLVGVGIPFWVIDPLKNIVGHRHAEKSIQLGSRFTCSEALEIGLVDELCDPDELLGRATTEMNRWLQIPDHARILTKKELRKDLINKLVSKRQEDVNRFTSMVQETTVQKTIGTYLAKIKRKSK